MNENVLQIIGYASTVIVLISFLMTSVVKLRIVNTIGSLVFTVYALLIRSYPTAILNLGIVCINIYYLVKTTRAVSEKSYGQVEKDSVYLNRFIQKYHADISAFFPRFDEELPNVDRAYFVYADMIPVGLVMGRQADENSLELIIDYALAQYRDFSVGRYILPTLLQDGGYSQLFMRDPAKTHLKYLDKTGFVKDADTYRLFPQEG